MILVQRDAGPIGNACRLEDQSPHDLFRTNRPVPMRKQDSLVPYDEVLETIEILRGKLGSRGANRFGDIGNRHPERIFDLRRITLVPLDSQLPMPGSQSFPSIPMAFQLSMFPSSSVSI